MQRFELRLVRANDHAPDRFLLPKSLFCLRFFLRGDGQGFDMCSSRYLVGLLWIAPQRYSERDIFISDSFDNFQLLQLTILVRVQRSDGLCLDVGRNNVKGLLKLVLSEVWVALHAGRCLHCGSILPALRYAEPIETIYETHKEDPSDHRHDRRDEADVWIALDPVSALSFDAARALGTAAIFIHYTFALPVLIKNNAAC